MKNNKRFSALFLWASFIATVLFAGCATTPVSSSLVQKPEDATTAIRVIYINSEMITSGGMLLNGVAGSDALSRVGYFTIGDRVSRLAPPLLAARGLKAEARQALSARNFPGGIGYGDLIASAPKVKGSRLLVMSFKDGQSTNYGGPGATLNLQVMFRDVMTPTVYWNGTYRSNVKSTPFGGVVFDDKYVGEILTQIFSDMEKAGLLPSPSVAQATSRGPGVPAQ